MTYALTNRIKCGLFLHRWQVVEIKNQKSFADLAPMDRITEMSMSAEMVKEINSRKSIVTYRCIDCGTERVQRI